MAETSTESGGLKRNLSLMSAISLMTGCIVGASIFIVPGQLSATTGPTAWLSYLIGGILILFSCFMFAQVGSVLPVTGANYMLCTGSVSSVWGFLYVMCYLLGDSFLFPIMSRTIAMYLGVFFPAINNHITMVSVIILVVTCLIALMGNDFSSKIQNGCVILLVSVVLIFSFGGIINADWSHFVPMFPHGINPVIMGAISTYYAFAGVNCIIDLSGEIKKPEKNIPRTVFVSFGIVLVMYIGMCVGLVGLIPADQLGVATPAVDAAKLIFPGWFSYFIALAAVAACWTTLNAIISAMSRVLYVLGKNTILPKKLGKTNKHGIPSAAVIVLSIIGVVMVLFSATIMQYVNVSSFYLLLTSLLVAVASLKIKKVFSKEYEGAAYKLKGAWYYIWPALAIISSVVFMILQFTSDIKMTGISIILLPIGVALYLTRKRKIEATGVNLDQEIMKGM